MKYGTLASSHLNMALRCFQMGMVSTITGKTFDATGYPCKEKTGRSIVFESLSRQVVQSCSDHLACRNAVYKT
jgi:hypothetical protein